MPSQQNKIKALLSESTQRKFVVLFGSGTSALIATLKVLLPSSKKKVGIPANVCPSVPISVYAANKIPIYLDIDRETSGISPKALLRLNQKLDALIAVHSYGNPCKINEIEKICSDKGIQLIEDAAVSQGAWVDDRPVGSFGRVSIFSFGAGKIVSVGKNGAALTDDPEIAKFLEKQITKVQGGDPVTREIISKLHTFLYNHCPPGHVHKFSYIFRNVITKEIWGCSYNDSFSDELFRKLKRIKENIARREHLAGIYSDIFFKENFPVFIPIKGAVYWRYNIFLPQKRDFVLKAMLAKGYLISSWYPSIVPYLECKNDFSTPVTDSQGKKILNFWVNEETDEKGVRKTAQAFIELLGNHNEN